MRHLPGRAAVPGAQDERVVADRPAEARIVHVHRRQQGADGHAGLFPAFAVILRDQNVAALAHHHQA